MGPQQAPAEQSDLQGSGVGSPLPFSGGCASRVFGGDKYYLLLPRRRVL